MFRGFSLVTAVSLILILSCYGVLDAGRLYGPCVFAMGAIPLLAALLWRLKLSRLLPDIMFGAIDTGLLVVAALIGAARFGVIGAVVGSAVGDAITDGIAGFFEGGIAEWLRGHGIEESRTAVGSACGKMAGCLLGSGLALTLAWTLGFGQAFMAT